VSKSLRVEITIDGKPVGTLVVKPQVSETPVSLPRFYNWTWGTGTFENLRMGTIKTPRRPGARQLVAHILKNL
jgi:hypothetical protein